MNGITYLSASFRPQAEDISSIQFIPDAYTYYAKDSSTFWYDAVGKYAERQMQSISIDDPEILSIVANVLDENMERFDRGAFYFEGTQRTVAIKTGAFTRYRRIFFTRKTMNTLLETAVSAAGIQRGYLSLPQALPGTENVQLGSQGLHCR